jgi:hypothetical protein
MAGTRTTGTTPGKTKKVGAAVGAPDPKRSKPSEEVSWLAGGPDKVPTEPFQYDVEDDRDLRQFREERARNVLLTVGPADPFSEESLVPEDQKLAHGKTLFEGAQEEAAYLTGRILHAQRETWRDEVKVTAAQTVADTALTMLECVVGPVAKSAVFQAARGRMAPKGEPLLEEEAWELQRLYTDYGQWPMEEAPAKEEIAAEEQEFNARHKDSHVLVGAKRKYDACGPVAGEYLAEPYDVLMAQLKSHAMTFTPARAKYFNHEMRRLGAQLVEAEAGRVPPTKEIRLQAVATAAGLMLQQIHHNGVQLWGEDFNGVGNGWAGEEFCGEDKKPSAASRELWERKFGTKK